jgi:hypothetical protein
MNSGETDSNSQPRRRWPALLRSAMVFVNLFLWSSYGRALRPLNYSFDATKVMALAIVAVTSLAWLISVRAGIIIQFLVIAVVLGIYFSL